MPLNTPVEPRISGIHHVTAIAGDPQKNFDFYSKLLGLRFVKKTINFDDPHTYHLYFGNETGQPGTILTFFPWSSQSYRARRGAGQITTMSFSINHGSDAFWIERLKKCDVEVSGPFKRFDDEVIFFEDHDGFQLELVLSDDDVIAGWDNNEIPPEHSIRGFHSVTISLNGYTQTEKVLEKILGLEKYAEIENRHRYKSKGHEAGKYLDILDVSGSLNGTMGVGAVHHIAWRASTTEEQLLFRKKLLEEDLSPTPIIDRNYFHSVYFREPGNVIFEIATDPPGFLVDEDEENLGKNLKLPAWYEKNREEIENALPPLNT